MENQNCSGAYFPNEKFKFITRLRCVQIDTDDGRPAVCSTAILEAKKWLNEKRLGLGSTSTLKLDDGPCTLNSTLLPVVGDPFFCCS